MVVVVEESWREREAKKKSLKDAGIVFAALAFGWMVVEFAVHSFRRRRSKTVDKPNPHHDRSTAGDGNDAPSPGNGP